MICKNKHENRFPKQWRLRSERETLAREKPQGKLDLLRERETPALGVLRDGMSHRETFGLFNHSSNGHRSSPPDMKREEVECGVHLTMLN